MIILKNITKCYKTDFWKAPFLALDDVSFEIRPSSITGFLGANGAGKTTAIKIILGITSATQGQIDFSKLGQNKQEFLKNLGYMPERPYYYRNVTGLDFLNYMAKLNGMDCADRLKKINYWSERLSIAFALKRNIGTYSKGMLQRLGIVSAVVHAPKLIMLDEPVSGMDPIGRKEIKEILKELNQKEGITIFFSTHIIPDVEDICDQLIFLKSGKLAYSGPLDQIQNAEQKKFDIIYQTGEGSKAIEVSLQDKEKKLKELLNQGAIINKVSSKVLKLEDFLYLHEQ